MKTLPNIMPDYEITQSDKAPFEVKWEEMMGWFIVPKLGEKLSWAMYDFPDRKRSETYSLEVVGRASVHGIDGVEIIAEEYRDGKHETIIENRKVVRTFVSQLTDTHCRILAESHFDGNVKRFYTFLDADDFLPNWGFGEDNRGNETNPVFKGAITRAENKLTCSADKQLMDIIGRYEVRIGGKAYDTICLVDIELYNGGVFSEQYIDNNGKTVLWRRFNKNNWHFELHKALWTEMMPDNEKVYVNGEVYVHWYDCITDYII